MKIYFLDTSAILKILVQEKGSQYIKDIFTDIKSIKLIGEITYVEVISGLTRKKKMNEIDDAEYKTLLKEWDEIWQLQSPLKIDTQRIYQAANLVKKYGLRAYDGLQLSFAVKTKEILKDEKDIEFYFVSSDNSLLQAASSENFKTINPQEF